MSDTPAIESMASSLELRPPKYIFIVPYRDREPHRVFFDTYIHKIMEDVPKEDWDYFFIQQNDKRPFNRGGMKNIGFLVFKNLYPKDYKDIIFIFNDVDTLPYDKNILNFHTHFGVIKHYYGFEFALGGIFSVRGADFEKTNGFPNYWAWGGEDNLMNERAKNHGIIIDRTNFFKIGDNNILQFADGIKRLICRDELATSLMPNNIDGISTITNLNYYIYKETHMVDVTSFDTFISPYSLSFEEQTLDKLTKIRVSKDKAMRNIKELKTRYFLESNGVNVSTPTQNNTVNHSIFNAAKMLKSGTTSSQNAVSYNKVNEILQPKMPLQFNLNESRPRKFGTFIPERPNTAAHSKTPETPNAPPPAQIQGRMYRNHTAPNIVIPLQRQATAADILQHNRFGMRAMFM